MGEFSEKAHSARKAFWVEAEWHHIDSRSMCHVSGCRGEEETHSDGYCVKETLAGAECFG